MRRWVTRESGQGIVEAAAMVPLCLLMLFAMFQMGWMALCTSELDAGISHMQQAAGSVRDAATAKDLVLQNSTVLNAERLTVDGFTASEQDRSNTSRDVPQQTPGNSGRGWAASRNDARRTHVTCQVTYDCGLVFPVPGLSGLAKVTRSVDYSEVDSREFEVR